MMTPFLFLGHDLFPKPAILCRLGSFLAMVAFAATGFAIDPNCIAKVDWTTLPSTYTHDVTGNRVKQYAQGVEPVSHESPDFQRSGFRHTRSTLQAGNSSDNFHVVERWGGQVQPYGEWRYPYRPYSVPYGAWGPQAPLVNAPQNNSWNANFQAGNAFPGGNPWQGGGGNGWNPGAVNPGNVPPNMLPNMLPGNHPQGNWHGQPWQGSQPWHPGFNNFGFGVGPNNALRPDQDDYYAPAPEAPPVSDRDFFFVPNRP